MEAGAEHTWAGFDFGADKVPVAAAEASEVGDAAGLELTRQRAFYPCPLNRPQTIKKAPSIVLGAFFVATVGLTVHAPTAAN